jgi:hypothetical protein
MSILGDTKEVARASIQECVGCGRSRGQDDSVYYVRKNGDVCALHCNDPWRGLGTLGIFVGELRVVARNDHSDEE